MSRVDRMVLDIKGPGDFHKLRPPAREHALRRHDHRAASRRGRLDMALPDGRTLRFDGKEPGPAAEMIVHDRQFARTVAARGDIGFAEVFMDGQVRHARTCRRCSSTSTTNWEDAGHSWRSATAIAQFFANLRHVCRANTKKGSKRNILAHYDLGNDFYSRLARPDDDLFVGDLHARPKQPLRGGSARQVSRDRAATCS